MAVRRATQQQEEIEMKEEVRDMATDESPEGDKATPGPDDEGDGAKKKDEDDEKEEEAEGIEK